jgi:hypothetical protein
VPDLALDEQLQAMGDATIVVGLPTYNNARSISRTLEAVREGLVKHFGQVRAVVVVSDGGSTDGTADLAQAASDAEIPVVVARHDAPPDERLAVPYHGVPGRAAAQRIILDATGRLGARGCALLTAEYRTVEPDWIDRLLRPVLDGGRDYVSPLCQRQRYDGTLTSMLIYPLVRALYGRRIRQPLGGPFALSARLAAALATTEAWNTGATRHGVDLWAIAAAVAENLAIGEAWLGPCRLDAEARPADLGTIFAQAMGGTFALVEQTADVWADIRGSEPWPAPGPALSPGGEPAEPNVEGMVRAFMRGLRDLLPLWEQVLAPDTLVEVLGLESAGPDVLRFPHDLWARVVYDFALGYRFRTIYRDHLLRSLVPLYLGRTAACVRDTLRRTGRETDDWIEQGCAAFERQKAYLVERWR